MSAIVRRGKWYEDCLAIVDGCCSKQYFQIRWCDFQIRFPQQRQLPLANLLIRTQETVFTGANMISNAHLPAYNRFDRIPRHTLQCGIPDADVSASHQMNSTRMQNEDKPHLTQLDLTGSKNSLDSVSTISQDGGHSLTRSNDKIFNQSSIESDNSVDSGVVTKGHQDLYIERSSPPPYHNGGSRSNEPCRANLPKKSQAAQDCVADLLKNTSDLKPFGKQRHYSSTGRL